MSRAVTSIFSPFLAAATRAALRHFGRPSHSPDRDMSAATVSLRISSVPNTHAALPICIHKRHT